MGGHDDEDVRRWFLLNSKIQQSNVASAFRFFRAKGIEPILIKGWAAALNYPDISQRQFSDIDLCIAPGQFEKATHALLNTELKANIDLHCGFKYLDTLDFESALKDSALADCEGEAIRILRNEDHLRILAVHWLIDGGAYKNKLFDIYHLIDKNRAGFDWERCLSVVSPVRRRWIICTIGLAHKYLGLEIEGLPFAAEARRLPPWLIKAVRKEWASETRLLPLQTCLHDRSLFFKQLMKRIPPNPIQATIEMEGGFDKLPRAYYQAASIFSRMLPSIKRLRKRLSYKI